MIERRDDLARARVVAGYTQESLAEALGVDWRSVRRWEAGTHTPRPDRRGALARVSGCDLRELNGLLGGARVGGAEPSPDGGVASVRAVSRHLIGLDTHLGAHASADVAVSAATWAGRALGRPARTAGAEREMTAAVAELFEVAGWIAFDAERQEEAARLNRRALALAALAGDRQMENLTKLNMSIQSTHVRKFGEAVDLAQSVMDSGVTARVRAMCAIRQARVFSKAGNRRAAKYLADAHALFQDGISQHDPEWAWWIDEHEMEGHTAGALLELNHPGEAAERLWRLVEALRTSDQPNYRISTLRCKLLTAMVVIGQWSTVEGELATLEATFDEIGSTRARRSLSRTVHIITGAARVPSTVRDLAHVLGRRLGGP